MKAAVMAVLCLFSMIIFTASASAGEINVSAAASLREVVSELCDRFGRKEPSVQFRKNYGASGALARQIDSGLPADVFISANLEWMDYLKHKGEVDSGSIRTFTRNALVFAGNPGTQVAGIDDLLKLNKIAIGSPRGVPAGEYAVEALKRAGVEKKLASRLVMAKDVRDCLTYAERGEVDGAFVYRTDALQARRVKVLFTVPQDLYPAVVYPMGLTASGRSNAAASSFYRYLQSEEAKAVLLRHGFPK